MQFYIRSITIGISTPLLGENISCNPVYYTGRNKFPYPCFKYKLPHELSGPHLEDSVTFNVDIADRTFIQILTQAFGFVSPIFGRVVCPAYQFHFIRQLFIILS